MAKDKDREKPAAADKAPEAAATEPKACAHARAYICAVGGKGQLVKRCPDCGNREEAPKDAKPGPRPMPLGHLGRCEGQCAKLESKIARQNAERRGKRPQEAARRPRLAARPCGKALHQREGAPGCEMTLDPSITKEKVLTGIHGERRWFCEPFMTDEATDLLSEVLDVAVGGGSRTLDQILDMPSGAIGAGAFFSSLGGLPRRFLGAGGSVLLKRLLSRCEVEDPSVVGRSGRARKSLALDLHFQKAGQGNIGEVFRAAYWVCEVNWGPLFAEITGLLGALSTSGGQAQPDSESQIPSSEIAAA